MDGILAEAQALTGVPSTLSGAGRLPAEIRTIYQP